MESHASVFKIFGFMYAKYFIIIIFYFHYHNIVFELTVS